MAQTPLPRLPLPAFPPPHAPKMGAFAIIGGFYLSVSFMGKSGRLKHEVTKSYSAARARSQSVHALEVTQANSFTSFSVALALEESAKAAELEEQMRLSESKTLTGRLRMNIMRKTADGEWIWTRFHPIVITVSGR